MTSKQIEFLGWKRDFNLDGEDYPPELPGAMSMGFIIDRQLAESKTAWLLYHYESTGMTVVERVVDCGIGEEDKLYRGKITDTRALQYLMYRLGIPRNYNSK